MTTLVPTQVADVQASQRAVNRTTVADSRWYAAQVRSRHEKVVQRALEQRKIQYFLPVYRSVRQWKDRRKEIERVLFPGYIFVHFDLREKMRVLKIPGVLQFVGRGSQPVEVPEREIEPFQLGLCQGIQVLPHPFLQTGRRVRVRGGPLAGIEGIMLRRKDRVRLVISVEMIMQSAVVEVDETDVVPT